MGWLAESGLPLAGFTHENAGPLGWVVPPLSTLLAAQSAAVPPRFPATQLLAWCQGAGGPLPAITARTRPISRGLVPLIGVVFILLGPGSPAAAAGAGAPIRWNTGGAVWSTSQDAFDTFLRTGEVTDRGLAAGLASSGWPVDQMRAALAKTYTVDFLAVSRFLDSEAGERFLRRATTSYGPYDGMNATAVPALRSAILSDAADGSISSAGILRALPTAFRLADSGNGHTGAQPICAPGHCRSGTAQCTSLLSWYAFLPACLQARQLTSSEGPQPAASAP
jgi:hypothetical protein